MILYIFNKFSIFKTPDVPGRDFYMHLFEKEGYVSLVHISCEFLYAYINAIVFYLPSESGVIF
jgi:hypothetical protein